VAQASTQRQQLINLIQGLSRPKYKLKGFKQLSLRRLTKSGGTLAVLAVIAALLIWNWKLLLATGTGVLVMLGVYLMQQFDWKKIPRSDLRKFFTSATGQLTLAVGSGGLATLSSYLAISICVDSESSWIAAGAIVQGLGTMAVLVLLVWQTVGRQTSGDESKLNQLVTNLIDADPLSRLIAVRQLTHLVSRDPFYQTHRQTTLDYFRLMLSSEQEPVVREAVLEGLQALDYPKPLNIGAQPLSIPAGKKRTAVKAPQRIS
jgi:hypothetical protein